MLQSIITITTLSGFLKGLDYEYFNLRQDENLNNAHEKSTAEWLWIFRFITRVLLYVRLVCSAQDTTMESSPM